MDRARLGSLALSPSQAFFGRRKGAAAADDGHEGQERGRADALTVKRRRAAPRESQKPKDAQEA
jgi:hypothetical protein